MTSPALNTQWLEVGGHPYGPVMEYEEIPETQPEVLDWENGTGLIGVDDPAIVDAAFERGERHVGVAVIGLALNHPDPDTILPRVARALRATDPELQRQGTVSSPRTLSRRLPGDPGSKRRPRPARRGRRPCYWRGKSSKPTAGRPPKRGAS